MTDPMNPAAHLALAQAAPPASGDPRASGVLTYGSVCSGIEAASVAWGPLGWRCAFLSEIDRAPRAVLKHRFPDVPLHGDFTTIKAGQYDPIDLLVGGTPCQDYSVAGPRKGLDGDRGRLTLEFIRLAERLRPRWVVWENVPGCLSTNGGRDFGAVLRDLGQAGYGFAYRVPDAQFVRVDSHPRAVPQRRKRVFLVGYLGDWRPPAAVLFEPESLRGDSPPRRKAREDVGPTLASRAGGGGGLGTDAECSGGLIVSHDPAVTLTARDRKGPLPEADLSTVVFSLRGREDGAQAEVDETGAAPALRSAEGGSSRPFLAFDPNQVTSKANRSIPRGDVLHTMPASSTPPMVAYGIRSDASREGEALTPSPDAAGRVRLRNPGLGITEELAPTIDTSTPHAVAFNCQQDPAQYGDISGALGKGPDQAVMDSYVRRLTPRECERLQGFPDDWTLVPWRKGEMPDSHRYAMCGNSMAVNVMSWIGQRIQMVEDILAETRGASFASAKGPFPGAAAGAGSSSPASTLLAGRRA